MSVSEQTPSVADANLDAFSGHDGFVEQWEPAADWLTLHLFSDDEAVQALLRRLRQGNPQGIAEDLFKLRYTTPHGAETAILYEVDRGINFDVSPEISDLEERLEHLANTFRMDAYANFYPLDERYIRLAVYTGADIARAKFDEFAAALKAIEGVVNVWLIKLEVLEHSFDGGLKVRQVDAEAENTDHA